MAIINGGYVSDATLEQKAKRMKNILELLLNNPDGLSIKEVAIDLGLSSETVRRYMKELLTDGDIKITHKVGKLAVYAHKDSTARPAAIQELPEHIGGRTFEEVKPAIHVNQGDVIWCSSRSGDGQFFRYLVMVPWERKATVLGIFPQGHPALNMNDARFVSIGVDPETGEELYADISNACSRGYAQFGEKLMTISAENLAEVKRVMARYHRIPQKMVPVTKVDDDIWKKRFEDLSVKLTASMNEASIAGSKIVELTEANDDLKQQLKTAYLECDEKKQACEEAQKTAKDAIGHISELEAENKKLWENNKVLEEAVAQQEDHELRETISADHEALLWKISLLEQELKDKNEFITVLKQITFKSLKGGE